MPEVVTPEWVKHAVFYQIFPDRFAMSPHVPSLEHRTLGQRSDRHTAIRAATCLAWRSTSTTCKTWASLPSTSTLFSSRRRTTAITHTTTISVDPLLGGDAAFDALLTACKQRGMRVVLDGVFNHASRGFFQFNDMLENGAASPWIDWFTYLSFRANAYDRARPPGYVAWWGLHALPEFNTDNPQVREFMMRIGEYWMRKGIDGWRLDVPNEIDDARLLAGVPPACQGDQPRGLHRRRDLG